MKSPINLYTYSQEIFRKVMSDEYENHRRGLFDFPSKEKWLDDQWNLFCLNNPKLVGLTYDKKNEDWVHEYVGGSVRKILKCI